MDEGNDQFDVDSYFPKSFSEMAWSRDQKHTTTIVKNLDFRGERRARQTPESIFLDFLIFPLNWWGEGGVGGGEMDRRGKWEGKVAGGRGNEGVSA